MPRCACMRKRGIYGSVFVCLCVCVDCYSCSRMNQVQVRVSIGFYSHVYLDFNSWICKIMLCFRVMPTWNAIAAFSEEHVAKLVYRVLLLYLVVSSALKNASYSMVAARVRRELQGSANAAINFRLELLASIVFNNNNGDHYPLCEFLHAAKLSCV